MELETVLAAKFGLTDAEVGNSVKLILGIGRKVRISAKLRVVTDDADDDKFLETAIAGGADFIVSGDRHLLRLREYKDVQIVKASDFLELAFKE
jgi:putative PIN family toxin of toxin-antitoxin system